MIFSFEDVIRIHEILIEQFGGSPGLRDESLLEAALNRPNSSFDGKDLYPDVLSKSNGNSSDVEIIDYH